jgi:hypothetical protein
MKLNDDKSPLTDLLTCIVCNETMKLEKSAPDGEGGDLIQYRCELCERIERVRLFRRSRGAAGGGEGEMTRARLRQWTEAEVHRLRTLAKRKVSADNIAKSLGRYVGSVKIKARELSLILSRKAKGK